jgi:pyruvate dehydrogenase E2 component (dihydrolipoamide acetyltransferase)
MKVSLSRKKPHLLRSTAKNSEITAKARLLLAQNGLQAELVTPIDGRITVEAVERYLAAQGGAKAEATKATESRATDVLPDVAGNQVSLSREEKGMAATVTWHRDFAVAGYIEIEYELGTWVEYAKQFQDKNGLLMPPLLPLMAWRLIQIAQEKTHLNATIVGNKRYEYSPVNLGLHHSGRGSSLLGSRSQCANSGRTGLRQRTGRCAA